jgi:glycine dehydrogenase subunit 2
MPVLRDGKYLFETPKHSIGPVKAFYGHFLVVVRALTYLLILGREGIPHAAQTAVLTANYMMHKLKTHYAMAFDPVCMHEFVMTLEKKKRELGVTALGCRKNTVGLRHSPTHHVFSADCSRVADARAHRNRKPRADGCGGEDYGRSL